MKTLMISAVLLCSTASAQSIDLSTLKNFMLERKTGLELLTPGMSKRLTTLASLEMENGEVCNYKQVEDQSVLKIIDDKVLIYSLQKFMPANSPSCLNNGLKPFAENILFYETKPQVEKEIEEFEVARDKISSIQRTGNQFSIVIGANDEKTTFIYEFNQPLFKSLLSVQGEGLNITVTDLSDISPSSIDLTKVLFCEIEDHGPSNCVEGDYSDFLFD